MALAPCGARTWRPFILGACCHAPHATYPDGEPETALEGFPSHRPYSVLLPVGFTVPLLLPVARWALTPPFHPCHDRSWRFAFCGTFPRVAPAGRYPAPCFHGARTFLHEAKPRSGHPADWLKPIRGNRRGKSSLHAVATQFPQALGVKRASIRVRT